MRANAAPLLNIGKIQDDEKMQTAREELAQQNAASTVASRLGALSIKMVGTGVGVLVDARAEAKAEAARKKALAEAEKRRRVNLGDVCGANYTETERKDRAKTVEKLMQCGVRKIQLHHK